MTPNLSHERGYGIQAGRSRPVAGFDLEYNVPTLQMDLAALLSCLRRRQEALTTSASSTTASLTASSPQSPFPTTPLLDATLLDMIAHPGALLAALTDLAAMIGLAPLKQAVVDQLLFLLSNIRAKGRAHATDGHVLNVLLYGPPGTGKSDIGLLLARIWTAVGVLARTEPPPLPRSRLRGDGGMAGGLGTPVTAHVATAAPIISPVPVTEDTRAPSPGPAGAPPLTPSLTQYLLQENLALTTRLHDTTQHIERARTAALATNFKLRELRGKLFALRTANRQGREIREPALQHLGRMSAEALDYVGSATHALTVALDPGPSLEDGMSSDSTSRESPEDGHTGDAALAMPPGATPPAVVASEHTTPGQPRFKAVSRVDFVAGYVGQTAERTTALLRKWQGGVLFVDEAYSLYQGERDVFGAEALNVLNQHMTEHPQDTIVIFAGYRDLMQDSVFHAQPGLVRRFAFTFEIGDYTPEELAQIFLLQIQRDGWGFAPRSMLTDFFREHHAAFPSFGGDTRRLLFHCKLVHSRQQWEQLGKERTAGDVAAGDDATGATGGVRPAGAASSERMLTPELLTLGFERYRTHQPLTAGKRQELEQRRRYERATLEQQAREQADRDRHRQLYDDYRDFEREEMARRMKEGRERAAIDARCAEYPLMMYQ